jgi:hypothetical protein
MSTDRPRERPLPQSRLEGARRRARAAKRAAAGVAAALFALGLVAARASHPGAAATTSPTAEDPDELLQWLSDQGFTQDSFGSGSIAPSVVTKPPAQTSTS